MQSHTHVGQGERAAAAALIGLLVASQLVEGARLAEQRPDVLGVQAQRLLAVLQRLLIQALPERSRCSVSPYPPSPKPLPLPPPPPPRPKTSLPSLQRQRMPEDPAQGEAPELQETALVFTLRSRASLCPAAGAANCQDTGGRGLHATVTSPVTQTRLFRVCLQFRTPWTEPWLV